MLLVEANVEVPSKTDAFAMAPEPTPSSPPATSTLPDVSNVAV
jgi:hypothetical protein